MIKFIPFLLIWYNWLKDGDNMETLNYLIEKLIKENDELSNIVIPKSLNEKKDYTVP